jgi:hypothetical protein
MCAVCVDAAGRHTSSTVNRWEIGRVENRISPQSVLFFFSCGMLHEVERFNFHHVAGCCRMDDGPFLFISSPPRVVLCRTHAASGDYMARSWSIDD